ncbi:MAG: citrate (Si)-synthase [Chlamydiota bacterium]
MEEILFEVTKDQLETGMRGYPVGYCTTSAVDPHKGLSYRGRFISELCQWDPERVLHLLYTGKEGTAQDIAGFSDELKKRAHCSHAVIKAIEELPRQGHAMKLFSTALLILGMLEGQGDYRKDCLNVMAKIPHLVACVINAHAGFGETPQPRKDLGYMENFAYMVQVPDCNEEKLAPVLRIFNLLHYDHGGGNLSAFVGKSVASGLSDLYNSLSAAMCALAGPRHGKANQDCLAFLRSILDELGSDPSADAVRQLVEKRLAAKQLIFGFGHAVLRVEDPRAAIFYSYAEEHFADHPLIKIALLLRTEGQKVLAKNPKVANPYPNVDAISGAVLAAAGFDYPDYFTVLFGLSRVVGIAIQIVYERMEAREGKGTPIVRPRYLYKPMT